MQPVYQKSNRRKRCVRMRRQQNLPTYRYNFKATVTDGTADGHLTFFRPAGDEVTGHPRSETAKKYKGISSSTRKGSADFSVDAILDKPAMIEGASSSKEDTQAYSWGQMVVGGIEVAWGAKKTENETRNGWEHFLGMHFLGIKRWSMGMRLREGNMIHCTAKSNVAHNFLRLKEGRIYSVKKFVVLLNKDEFWIFKHDMFMLEFDGETTTRKVSTDPLGYLRYPFQLMDFDRIQPANNKYLIDVTGYVTNVGRTTYTKSGSKTLDFYLVNQRVTLWGGLGDVLVERKTKHVGMCVVVLTAMSAKDYNNKLYLSCSSSTIIYDDDDIPCLHELKTENICVEPTKAALAVDCSQPKEGTLENLLIWARNRKNNQPSTIRKGDTRQHEKWLCEACNRTIDYPVFR
ncbi:replication protein A 70 kDa DNA-binding subunit C-like protein [Tanacetum coccineum]